jgi:hypothetical protein
LSITTRILTSMWLFCNFIIFGFLLDLQVTGLFLEACLWKDKPVKGAGLLFECLVNYLCKRIKWHVLLPQKGMSSRCWSFLTIICVH